MSEIVIQREQKRNFEAVSVVKAGLIFLRRAARLVAFVSFLLGGTVYLNLTIRRHPPSFRDRYRAICQRLACARAIRSIGIKVRVVGARMTETASLLVSNHLGMIDPMVLASRFELVFSGKAEMFDMPVVGWVCRSIGLIPVHRGRRTKAATFAEAVAAKLHAGIDVLAFPEGTTSAGTDLLPFKTGAFAAVEYLEDGTVLPLTLRIAKINGAPPGPDVHSHFTWSDATQSMLAHFWEILGVGSAEIEIIVGEPIATAGRSRKELAEACYRVIRETSVAQQLAGS